VHSHKARLLNLATRRTGATRYFDTWLKFFDVHWADQLPSGEGCHLFNKTLQHLPYGQAHVWNARWQDGALVIDPIASNYRDEISGMILTPRGPVTLKLARATVSWKIVEQTGPRGLRITFASQPPVKKSRRPAARRL